MSTEHSEQELEHFRLAFYRSDEEVRNLEQALHEKEQELLAVQALYDDIMNSRSWRMLGYYHHFRYQLSSFKQYGVKFIDVAKRDGFAKAFTKGFYLTKRKIGNDLIKRSKGEHKQLKAVYENLLLSLEQNEIKGIAIITSAFQFDELYNQRTINFAKYLVDEGYGVIYVAWQWYKEEKLDKSYQTHYRHVHQVNLFDFLNYLHYTEKLSSVLIKDLIFTFPAPQFMESISPLREIGFHVTYDNMDEWEMFHETGDAAWYVREMEEAMILASDTVTCVSEALRTKFSHLRSDIEVIGNGYYPAVSKYPFISNRTVNENGDIHVGYFGHMTESWFDWDLVFSLLEDSNIHIHLIGYGMSEETKKKLNTFSNAHFYGKIPPTELHEHVRKWHIGLIPFKKGTLSTAVDPIKIYEYLYFGLPTVSSGIPHLSQYPFTYHVDETAEANNAIQFAYANLISSGDSMKDDEKYVAFLNDTTWTSRFSVWHSKRSVANHFGRLYE